MVNNKALERLGGTLFFVGLAATCGASIGGLILLPLTRFTPHWDLMVVGLLGCACMFAGVRVLRVLGVRGANSAINVPPTLSDR